MKVGNQLTACDQRLKKFEALESIRGIAAILVVFYHMPQWNKFLQFNVFRNAYLMVELFFVLSGFVIYHAYADRLNDAKDYFRFQFLRFSRLYPVHFLFLVIFLAIEIAKYFARQHLGIESPNSQPFEINDLEAFVENLFLIQAVIPDRDLSFNGPAWSISVEYYTYATFGIIALVSKRREAWFFLIAATSLLLIMTHNVFGVSNLLRCLAGFYIGCITAWIANQTWLKLPEYTPSCAALALLTFLYLKISPNWDVATYLLAASLILSLTASKRGKLHAILECKSLSRMGQISYSVYMSHAAVLWVVNQAIRFSLHAPEEMTLDGARTPQLQLLAAIMAALVSIVITLVLSSVIYRYVESPVRAWSRQLVGKSING